MLGYGGILSAGADGTLTDKVSNCAAILRFAAAHPAKFAKPASKLSAAAKKPLVFCSFRGGLPDSGRLQEENICLHASMTHLSSS